MANLAELMSLPGAVAAFEFSDQGELVSHQIAEGEEVDPNVLTMLSHVCVANRSIASMQARGWETMTGEQGFYPIEGVGLIGLEWSAIVKGQTGIVIANPDANYQAVFDRLAAQD